MASRACRKSGKGLLWMKEASRAEEERQEGSPETMGGAEAEANGVSTWVWSWTSWRGPWGFWQRGRSRGVSGWEAMKSSSVDSFLENFTSWTKDRWNGCELMEFLWFKVMFYDHMTSAVHRLALKKILLLLAIAYSSILFMWMLYQKVTAILWQCETQ